MREFCVGAENEWRRQDAVNDADDDDSDAKDCVRDFTKKNQKKEVAAMMEEGRKGGGRRDTNSQYAL